jgi:hypothetical protein
MSRLAAAGPDDFIQIGTGSGRQGIPSKGESLVIVYDLKCDKQHKFEGWFKDLAAFEQQKAQKLITCPLCGSAEVAMMPSSIAVMGKSRELKERKANLTDVSPMKMLEMVHDFVSKNFDDVGERFAEVALKIHRGEESKRNIRGVTTNKEEETLREEGVEFVKIPVPKFDS